VHDTVTAFTGWPVEALEFYEGLEADNSKTYWQANRPVYDRCVRAPMEALLADLEAEFGPGKIFRPYRDVRFSRDKSPYKTHIGATIGDGYVQLDADRLAAGAGMWEMAPDQLERYRAGVDDARTGAELVSLVEETRAVGISVMGRDELKTAPRGFPKDHPRIELLRYKGLVTWLEWPAGPWLGTRRAEQRVVEFLRASQPIVTWLSATVGPSTLPHRRA
jgi:uncharacterized protein (TIGR02453 family)